MSQDGWFVVPAGIALRAAGTGEAADVDAMVAGLEVAEAATSSPTAATGLPPRVGTGKSTEPT